MVASPTIILQGIDVAQLFDLMKLAAREVLAEGQQAAAMTSEAAALPDELPAKQAAQLCGYATGKSLVQWHFKGLTPLRVNGKRIFYKKAEVVALKKRIFNL